MKSSLKAVLSLLYLENVLIIFVNLSKNVNLDVLISYMKIVTPLESAISQYFAISCTALKENLI
jgi:hypothetical protein